MATDFRADQVRLNRLISSGSTPILVYPSSSASDLTGGQTAEFVTSSVGTDVFFFVSGATDGTGKSLFGGDTVISGNVRIHQSLAQGNSTTVVGQYSHAEGVNTTAFGYGSHAEGINTYASNFYAHTEGNGTSASGLYSHAEGNTTQATGASSHAEGFSSIASGEASHAEGKGASALGNYSHAEGDGTSAYGYASHAEGYSTTAVGTGSLAAGLGTYAYGEEDGTKPPTRTQAAFGKYNIIYNAASLFVVGDGTNSMNTHDVFRVNSGIVEVTGSFRVLGDITGSISGTIGGNSFIAAGPNITANYNSLGQWEITGSGGGGGGGGTQKQYIAKYEETTSTTPIVIGQFSWVPSDYAGLTTLRVRAIMSTDGTVNHTGSLQIYNLTSGSYLDLVNSPSIGTTFNITSSIPTLVTSSNLLTGGTNFDNVLTSIYEVRISGSTANSTIVGGVELVYS